MSDVPSIPTTQVKDPALRPVIEAIRSMLLTRASGRDTMDRWVTWSDLVAAGIAQRYINGQPLPVPDHNGEYQPPPSGEGDDEELSTTPPPAPTDLVAVGGFAAIYLTWSQPAYNNLAYTEVWRSTTDNLGTAVKVGTTNAQMYADFIGNPGTYWYWVRGVSRHNDLPGDYNQLAGTSGTVSNDPEYLLDVLAGQITESHLYDVLNQRINLIDGPNTMPGSVNQRVNDLAQEVSLLAAGTGEQFDYALIFYFDGSTDGFAVNAGVLSNAGSWLVHKSSSGTISDPQLFTDDTLNVSGSAYPQVRMRIRKIGAPTWKGDFYYITTTDGTYDNDKKITVAEPSWNASNIGVITLDMEGEWSSGVIERMRMELGTAITASDYYELDWFAIGRPSPGASTAALQTEVLARTTADTALAAATTTLQTTVNGHTASIQTQQTSIDGLRAQYTVKIDNNGFIAGFGLSSETVNGVPRSSFLVNVDQFAITQANTPKTVNSLTRVGSVATATVSGHGYPVGGYVSIRNVAQAGWVGVHRITGVTANTFTFTVTGTPTTPATPLPTLPMQVALVTAPFIVDSGLTYINTAIIKDASITSAKIGSLVADKITAGYIAATVGLSAAQLHGASFYSGGTVTVNYDVNGVFTSFSVNAPTVTIANGVAEFVASSFRIRNAGGGANLYTPFEVVGGIVYLDVTRIRDASILTAKIADAQITSAKIATAAITTAKIADAQITTAKIADASITSAKIGTAAITSANIDTGAITNAKIQDAAITNGKIANAAITAAKIQDAAVDTLKIAGQAVTFSVSQYLGAVFSSNDNDVIAAVTLANPTGAPVLVQVSFIAGGGLGSASPKDTVPVIIEVVQGGVVTTLYNESYEYANNYAGGTPAYTPASSPFAASTRIASLTAGVSASIRVRSTGRMRSRSIVATEVKR